MIVRTFLSREGKGAKNNLGTVWARAQRYEVLERVKGSMRLGSSGDALLWGDNGGRRDLMVRGLE